MKNMKNLRRSLIWTLVILLVAFCAGQSIMKTIEAEKERQRREAAALEEEESAAEEAV